jgi:hypothetical protein
MTLRGFEPAWTLCALFEFIKAGIDVGDGLKRALAAAEHIEGYAA